jgi:signal peptidase I
MLGSVERYESAVGRKRAGIVRGRILRVLVITLLLYLVVSRFIASTYRIESFSMKPGLSPADRVIVSSLSYGARVPFSASRLPGIEKPMRGDLVVVQPPFSVESSVASRILEPLVGFFTLQKVTLRRDLYGSRVNSYMVKRVVGIPGDTVRLSQFALLIKPRGASDFVPELQLSPVNYQLIARQTVRGWSSVFPFSGNAADLLLKENEYFVLGDNRPESSDSRSWGPVSMDRIISKVVYRYWPPASIGKP